MRFSVNSQRANIGVYSVLLKHQHRYIFAKNTIRNPMTKDAADCALCSCSLSPLCLENVRTELFTGTY